jgi:DNA mismatch repair protein MLH3
VVKVIGQVDGKFISCVLPIQDGSKQIIMIDQHAADERVRLEVLTKELFDSSNISSSSNAVPSQDRSVYIRETVRLDPPVKISMSLREALAAQRYKQEFARWGIVS